MLGNVGGSRCRMYRVCPCVCLILFLLQQCAHMLRSGRASGFLRGEWAVRRECLDIAVSK